MEIKNDPQNDGDKNPPSKTLENKVTHIADTLEKLNSEIETIRITVNERKTETTTLKILFYTGSLILLLGLIYSTTTLQRAQLKNMDLSMALLQKRMKLELSMAERIIFDEIHRLRAHTRLMAGDGMPGVLSRMTDAISLVEPGTEKMAGLIQQVKQDSEELTQAYLKYHARLIASEKQPDTGK